MQHGIYINNHSLCEFGAKLQTDYHITGSDITNTTNLGPDRSSILLLRQSRGPLTITLPIDFYGTSKRRVMQNMTALAQQMQGVFEVDLSDGFVYSCMLAEVGETAWSCDELCSVDFVMKGFRYGEAVNVSGKSPLIVHDFGTWPKSDCCITLTRFTASAPVTITLRNEAGNKQQWFITPENGIYTGGSLVLDGIKKRNLYNSGGIPLGTMRWTDYPYIEPGINYLTVAGGTYSSAAVVFSPAFL